MYPLNLSYGLSGLANLPSVLSMQQQHMHQQPPHPQHIQHQQQPQQHMGPPQQPQLYLSAQQAQQLFDAASASSLSASASSTLSALASASNNAQLSYSPLQLQAAAAGMWPQLGNFLPVSLSLQHLQPAFGSAQPLAPQQQHQQQQQQQNQHNLQSQQQQQQQHAQLQSAAMSASALSNGVAPSVFPLPPAPMLPVAHPALTSAASPPQHSVSAVAVNIQW